MLQELNNTQYVLAVSNDIETLYKLWKLAIPNHMEMQKQMLALHKKLIELEAALGLIL
jgi:hypothetical protein